MGNTMVKLYGEIQEGDDYIMPTEESTKVIFLDIDGVLNNSNSDISQLNVIEESLLIYLKKIIYKTNATIVLSSSWRMTEKTRNMVREAFQARNIPGFASITPNLGSNRLDEIICWLQDNTYYGSDTFKDISLSTRANTVTNEFNSLMCRMRKKMCVTHWIAIDDMDLTKEGIHTAHLVDHFVHVDKRTGLTDKDVDLAITLLNK